jgi:prevent-host-death family protein
MEAEEIGARELKQRASEILRRVREDGASYAITYHGKVVARLEPDEASDRRARSRAIWAEIDELAKDISEQLWPNADAVEMVREQRPEL